MIYREYGTTGVSVSTLGFGGMRFANMDDPDTCAALVQAAYAAGINYFDTAPGYGKSEELFGIAFREMKKTRAQKPFFVSTKTMKSEPGEIREQLETSLKRMDLDYVDFYHVWCIMSPDKYEERKARGALREFEKLKAEGLIKHICVSTHMNGAETRVMLNDYPFAGVLLGYSAMNFAYREEGIAAAAELNQGVVVMNPLGGGLIPQHPHIFAFIKTQPEETVVQGALRFLINDPRITIALVGFAKENELQEAIHAVNGYQPIDSMTMSRMRNSLNQAFNEMCTGCAYCDSCPAGIPIPKLMDGYNQYLLTDDTKKMLMRLKWHWALPPESEEFERCTACGNCLDLCTQSLPIIDRIEFIRAQAEKYLAEQRETDKTGV